MSDLHAQIRIYVEDTIERIDSDDVVAAVSSQPVVSDRAGWYARSTWVFTGAAVLVLISVGLPILLIRGDGSIVVDQVTTAATSEIATAPTVTTATATTVPVTPARIEITWQQAPTQPAFGFDDVVTSVVEGGPGLVAVGGEWIDEYGYQAVVWTSVDGIAWERAENVPRFADVLSDVAVGPTGFVAVGGEGDNPNAPPILFSEDGKSWTRIPPDATAFPPGSYIRAVTDGGPGYVAVGTVEFGTLDSGQGQEEASIWTSTDGVSWTRIGQALVEGYELSAIDDIVNTGSALVAVGGAGEDDWINGFNASPSPRGDLFVWTSTDGQVWKRDALSSERGYPMAVGTHGEAVVAVGHEGNFETAWLAADAGEAFSAHRMPGFTRDFPQDVLGDGDRLLVVGGRSKVPSSPDLPIKSWALAWTSQDGGTTWYEVTSLQESTQGVFGMPNDQRPAGFRAVTAFGDGFVAVGGTGDGSAPVWTGTWNQN